MTEVPHIRCRFCGERNLLPVNGGFIQDERRDAKALLREVLDGIVANAKEPKHIASRVMILAKVLDCPSLAWISQAEIARFLGIGDNQASAAMKSCREKVADLLSDS